MRNIDYAKDGIEHINIYSKGKTPLGRMLSNFYEFPIKTLDGDFLSVEGYWYWLSIEDCIEKDILRTVSGIIAKNLGKKLLKIKSPRFDDNFESKISNAIWYKFKCNKHLLIEKYQDLPFEHYYNFSGNIMDVKDKYSWMITNIETMRQILLSEN